MVPFPVRPYREWPAVRWGRAHAFIVDIGFAGVLVAFSIVVHFHQRSTPLVDFRDPAWWTIALGVTACLPIAWRRSHPIPAVVAAVGFQILLESLRINGPGWLPVYVAIYSVGAHSYGRARLITAVLLTALFVGGGIWIVIDTDELTLIGVAAFLASVAVCFFVGDNMRRRRREISDLAARAETAERERELLASRRVADERTRIARELHDVVAHSVSVMVIQAAAAHRNLDRDRESSETLLVNIEETGRQTMRELRSILGVLRDADDDAPTTVPILGDLDALVTSIPDLDVRLERSGSMDAVPVGVALAAYRVVQEALTNAHRHGGPNVVVEVDVLCGAERVDVTVSDNGRGASTRAAESTGYGLLGMSERAAAFGGTLSAGPRRTGGWRVKATFPMPSAPGVVDLAS